MVMIDPDGKVADAKTLAGFKEKNKLDFSEAKQFLIKRRYTNTTQIFGKLSRTINLFYNLDGKVCRYYIVNYKIKQKDGIENAQFDAVPHGNAKSNEAFIRTKPSVLKAIKKYGKIMKPKHVISEVEKDAGGSFGADSQSDVVRNRRQVCLSTLLSISVFIF